MDLYNFSQDSLARPAAHVVPAGALDTPHMTLVSPAEAHSTDEKKNRLKRRDLKLRKLLFGADVSLQRQRSLVIKELMVGHGHQGCLMSSQPVQKELRKLLRKTMRLKKKTKKSSTYEKLRRWVTRRRTGRSQLENPSDCSATSSTCHDVYDLDHRHDQDSTYDQGNTRDHGPKDTGTDSYLTPKRLDSSRRSSRRSRRSPFPRRSLSTRSGSRRRRRREGRYHLEDDAVRASFRSSRSFRRDTLKRHSSSRSFRDGRPRSPFLGLERRRSSRRSQRDERRRVSPAPQRHHWPSGSLRRRDWEGRTSGRRPRSASLSSRRSRPQTSSSRRGTGSGRPDSRLERVRQAWRDDEDYYLNPFDSWRLRHHSHFPGLSSPSPPPSPGGAVVQERMFPERTPIRQRLRESWRAKERDDDGALRRPTPRPHPPSEEGELEADSPPPPLAPQPADVFFLRRPTDAPFFPPEAPPLVLGWLQVPPQEDAPFARPKSRTFRKAPWLQDLHFL
ncbi:serine/arginine repetitive matrix protein 1-like [Penaeus indicus]|uniref:serine/arginine repetitive matrix protein 1-like n=1 Tax=Penaeus indicus TaxID=29960 RepID=UPI00300C6C0B